MGDANDKDQTLLTPDECGELAAIMGRKYAAFLQQRHFEVSCRKDGRGIYAQVLLRNKSGSYYYPVEGRLAHSSHALSDRQAVLLLIDFIDGYFSEYFKENGDVYLPIDWADYESEGIPLQLKGQILNLEAEHLADALLGTDGDAPSTLH